MSIHRKRLTALLYTLLISSALYIYGCESSVDSSERDANNNEPTAGNNLNEGELFISTLEEVLRLEDSDKARGSLTLTWNEELITDGVEWSCSDESVATIEAQEGGVLVSAAGAGVATILATYQGQEVSVEVAVIAPSALVVTGPERALNISDTFTLGTKIEWSDESVEDVSDTVVSGEISWISNTEAASINTEGEVTILHPGQIEIIATVETRTGEEITGSWGAEIPCRYPEPTGRSFNTDLELNTVLPPVKWDRAYSAMDGSMSTFSMEEIYCSPDYDWVETITFMISAGWCTACPAQLRAVSELSDELLEAGGIVVYVEVQDEDGEPADSDFALDHLSTMLGSTNGFFVGDKETQPLTRFFGRSPALTAFPDAYVVRKSDMTILTSLDLNRQVGILPLIRITEQPEEDWTNIMPAPFESTCAEGEEEASEPNDSRETAAPITAGVHTGGICTEAPDYYLIDIEGDWTFTISFSHSEADIDILQYNVGQVSGDPVNGSNGTADQETLSGTDSAVIAVFSYTRTSATYSINLEAL